MWAAPQQSTSSYPVVTVNQHRPVHLKDSYFQDTVGFIHNKDNATFAGTTWIGEERNPPPLVKQDVAVDTRFMPSFMRSQSTTLPTPSLSCYENVLTMKPSTTTTTTKLNDDFISKSLETPVRVYRVRDEIRGNSISESNGSTREQRRLFSVMGRQPASREGESERVAISRPPPPLTIRRSPSAQIIYAGKSNERKPVEKKSIRGSSNLSKLSYVSLNDQRLYSVGASGQQRQVQNDRIEQRENDEIYSNLGGVQKSEASLRVYKHPSLNSLQASSSSTNPFAGIRSEKDQRLTQRIICVRHGERVDFVFGGNWAERAFDHRGNYQRINLNMPLYLPRRRNPHIDFIGDSPLTEIGMLQARLTGEALRLKAMYIHQCYVSPSLRCVQTAHNILKGMGVEKIVPIKIEPGLFEFIGWYERGIPKFIKPSELSANGYNIDLNYKPYLPVEKLNPKENYLDFYNRSYKTALNASERNSKRGCNILFSGHAATLEVCTRQLCGLPPRPYQEFNNVIRRVSYLGLNVCEKNPIDGFWSLIEPPIPPIQHSNNTVFDWKIMI